MTSNPLMNGLKWTGTLAMCLGMAACSSGPKVIDVEVQDAQFKVLEASPGGRETWLDNPHSFALETGDSKGYDTDKFYYYTGEGHSAAKRTACEKAQANVTDDIARQVAVFVDSSIARASSESSVTTSAGINEDGEVSEEMEAITSQLAKASLHGVAQRKKYWEKRDYSEFGGAKSIHYCWVLHFVKKKSVEQLIRRASTLRLRGNQDLRAAVGDRLQKIDQQYDKYMMTH